MNEDSLIRCEATVKTVDRHIKFLSSKIEEVRERSSRFKLDSLVSQSTIKFYRLNCEALFIDFEKFPPSVSDWRVLARCVLVTFRFIAVIKLLCLSVIHFKINQIREQLWPTYTLSELDPKCINQSATYALPITNATDRNLLTTYIELDEWLYCLGSLIRTFHGTVCTALLAGASINICFDFLGLVGIHFKRPRLDIYGLLKDKHAERRRFLRETKALVDDLFFCREHENSINGKKVYEYKA